MIRRFTLNPRSQRYINSSSFQISEYTINTNQSILTNAKIKVTITDRDIPKLSLSFGNNKYLPHETVLSTNKLPTVEDGIKLEHESVNNQFMRQNIIDLKVFHKALKIGPFLGSLIRAIVFFTLKFIFAIWHITKFSSSLPDTAATTSAR